MYRPVLIIVFILLCAGRLSSQDINSAFCDIFKIIPSCPTNPVDKPGYYIGGKTGTSQVIKNGVYASDETVGTYLGYGGTESTSRYVIMVQVSGDHKKLAGNYDAMPIFTDISNWMLGYLNIQPKG